MDFHQLNYIIKIAEEQNITRAAEKLFLTQSALNQHLLKLEQELGTQLFVRSRTDWRPTKAGEIYLENAIKILSIKKDTYNQISDLVHTASGHLSIGLTAERGISMFAAVYPKFYSRYPEVTVEPVELSVPEQLRLIKEGNLDLGFLTLKQKIDSCYTYVHLLDEELLLAVPATHSMVQAGSGNHTPRQTIELGHFSKDSFVMISKNSTLRTILDSLFKEAGFLPKVLFETRSNHTVLKMVDAGLCCAIIPESYAKVSENIVYFSLPRNPTWEVIACYKKGTYVSKATQYFIEMARQYWVTYP